MINLILTRGLKKLGLGKYLSISRFRKRQGLAPAPSASGVLCDGPDWSYPDGTPGFMNKGQSERYLRDQEMGKVILKYNKQFQAIEEKRRQTNANNSTNSH